MRAVIPFAMCILVAALVSVARAGDKPQLNGNWNFNPDQSDDAQQKVQDAQQNSQRASSGGGYPAGSTYPGGGYPGGGYPGGGYPGTGYPGGGGMGGMGRGGGMGRRGQGNPGGGVSSQDWDQLAANPKYLRINQHDDQIVIDDDSDNTRTLYPDGKKHEEKDADGRKTSTKTEWQGDALVTETRLHSGKLTESYRVSSDGKQLTVISRFDNSSLAGPLSIRRVYDMGKAAH
jgi:hypothetical protein